MSCKIWPSACLGCVGPVFYGFSLWSQGWFTLCPIIALEISTCKFIVTFRGFNHFCKRDLSENFEMQKMVCGHRLDLQMSEYLCSGFFFFVNVWFCTFQIQCVFTSHTPSEQFRSAPHHCQFPTDFSPHIVLPLNNHQKHKLSSKGRGNVSRADDFTLA